MLRLGLTGTIAAGKSTVLDLFEKAGVPVISADAVVHELYRGSAAPVLEVLFPGVVHNREVDRTELSKRVIGKPDELKRLEAAVHPLVRQAIGTFLSDAESTGAAFAIVDIPLLFESGHDYGLDGVIVVGAAPEKIRERALARPGMTVEKLDAILARQMPQADKLKRADYVIMTDGSLADTEAAVTALVAELTQRGTTQVR